MRPGPPRGATATLEVTVRADLVEPGEPAVYGTTQLAGDVTRVCRRLLEGHLEAGESATGVRLELLQRAPVAVGESLVLTATVASVAPASLTAEVLVRHHSALVARGSYELAIVADDDVAAEVTARARP
ncbi:MAG: thioesterase, FlK family [Nitriliruptoraceae bacterium]